MLCAVTLVCGACVLPLSTAAVHRITTIGYGDITPFNTSERIVAAVAMICGSSIYAYGLTHIITMVTGMNETKRAVRAKLDKINSYMHDRGLPKDLQADVREFMCVGRAAVQCFHTMLKRLLTPSTRLPPLPGTKSTAAEA